MAATNAMSYNAFVRQLGVMAVLGTQTINNVVVGVDSYFNAEFIAQALSYAELRIQRDLDLLPSRTNNAYNLMAGQSTLSIPTGDFVTILNVDYTYPNLLPPLVPVSQEFIQNVYNTAASQGAPAYFAMVGGDRGTAGTTSNNILFGPTPDQTYMLTVWGTIRMPSLATFAIAGQADSSFTFISTYLPDLLMQASMIYVSLFQRNFGATANDPQMGSNYEMQYQTLLKSAMDEAVRQKFFGSGWSSEFTSPTSTPGR